jgi:tetratricopeptide (TPR) repeat protein
MASSKITNRILLAAMIAMPTLPVLADYAGPSTYARWLLADAANQYDKGRVEDAHQSLQRAYDMSPDIGSDPNFWKQFERIEFDSTTPPSNTKIWSEMIRQIDGEPQRADAAFQIASLLLERKQFQNAVNLLEEFLPIRDQRTAIQNNMLAYARSLTGKSLDLAIAEIDAALKGEDNESFLDTKAWILHQLDRDEEALPLIDRSLSMLLGKLRANSVFEPMVAAMDAIEIVPSPAPSSQPAAPATTEEVGLQESDREGEPVTKTADDAERSQGWAHEQLMQQFPVIARARPEVLETLAVLHYHRMKILEGLGNEEEAERERRWLSAFSLKDLEEHY